MSVECLIEMLRIGLFDASFEAVKRVLSEVYPSMKIEHIVTDEKLKELGFVDFNHVFSDTLIGKEVIINEDGSGKLEWDFFYKQLESGRMIN